MSFEHRVLVTGISGFLGGHVALTLLRQGYAVRGTLRDPSRADEVRANLTAAGVDTRHLEFRTLDLTDDQGWAEAADGCHFLQHITSPFWLTMPKDENELILPAVEGTIRAILAALDAGHKRIVLTSSVAAIDGGHSFNDRPFTVNDWTEIGGRHVNAYSKAKTLAERAAWDLVKAEGVRERLAVINPGTMLGPLLDNDPGASVSVVQRLLKGQIPMIPHLILPYVDVRDVAEAQVAAMVSSNAGGRRHIVTNPALPLAELAQMLRDCAPDQAKKIPSRNLPSWMSPLVAIFDKSLRDNRAWLNVTRRYDVSTGLNLLQHPMRPTRDAVAASANALLQRGLA